MRMEKNRQRRKKRRLIIGIILITLLIILSAIYMWKKMQEQQVENEQKEIEAKMEENEKKLEEEKEYNGMKIKNIIINKNEKDIELKATIQNTTSKEFKAKKVTIVFLNDEKQVVTKYRYYLNNIKVGESIEIELIGENIGYASDFEIKD
jgi:hypothetical protein